MSTASLLVALGEREVKMRRRKIIVNDIRAQFEPVFDHFLRRYRAVRQIQNLRELDVAAEDVEGADRVQDRGEEGLVKREFAREDGVRLDGCLEELSCLVVEAAGASEACGTETEPDSGAGVFPGWVLESDFGWFVFLLQKLIHPLFLVFFGG